MKNIKALIVFIVCVFTLIQINTNNYLKMQDENIYGVSLIWEETLRD